MMVHITQCALYVQLPAKWNHFWSLPYWLCLAGTVITDKPRLIEALQSKRVRDIACGSSHSAAIISNGDLYVWSLGEYGRLGHGDNTTQLRPKQVSIKKYIYEESSVGQHSCVKTCMCTVLASMVDLGMETTQHSYDRKR